MGGVFNIYGAIVAALLLQLLPAILNHVGVSIYWADILFGVGALQVLTTAPAGIVDQIPKDLANLGRLVMRLLRRTPDPAGSAAE
jgi:branched-chain amino acid transport system permease protein